MSDEIKAPEALQTDGDVNAQNASSGEVQLQQTEADAPNPASESGAGAAAAAGTEAPASDAGAAGAAADEPTGRTGNASGTEAAEAAHEGESVAEKSAEARAAAATARLADAMVRAALQRVGIPEGRVEIAAKLMETDRIDPMAEDAAQRYAEAAQRLVSAVPEFVPAGGTGSAGEHPRRTANPNDDTTSAFRRGMGR